MQKQKVGRGILWLAALLVGLVVLQGCVMPASPVEYVQYRFNDAMDIFEFGVTYNGGEPQFGLYLCGVGVLGPFGVADLDVNYVGIGGGQAFGLGDAVRGPVRHRLKSWGVFVYGEEEMGWGEFDVDDPRTLNQQTQGVLGIIGVPLGPDPRGIVQGVQDKERLGHPNYLISCLHYFHFGHFGFVGNIRYLEPFDFIAGIFCLDPFQDDGPQPGRWWFQEPAPGAKDEEA